MGRVRRVWTATLAMLGIACVLTGVAYASAGVSRYTGTLQVHRTYQSYDFPDGTHDSSSDETVTFSDAVFATGSAGFSLQSAGVTYSRSPQSQSTPGGPTCITDYNQDTGKAPTGTLTYSFVSRAWQAKLTVYITARSSCGGTVLQGEEFWVIPLSPGSVHRLRGEFPLALDSAGTHHYPPTSSQPPATDQDSGTLYANSVGWSALKRDVKDQAQQRLRAAYYRAIAACDQKDARAQAYPITYYVFGGYPGVEACVSEVSWNYETAKAALDPPDPSVNAVALPLAQPRHPRAGPCGTLVKVRVAACRRVLAALRSYEASLATLNAIGAATVVTLNRGNTAQAAGDTTSQDLQTAALAVYAAWVHSAGRAVDAKARALATALRKAGVTLTVSARAASAQARRLTSGRLPSAVLKGLAAAGITRKALRSALSRIEGHMRTRALTLAATLRAPIGPPRLPAADLVVSPPDLSQLVAGLGRAGAIDANEVSRLGSALTAYESATTSAASAAALAALRGDVAAVHGSAGAFLATALTLL